MSEVEKPSWKKATRQLANARRELKLQLARADRLSDALGLVFLQDRVKGYPSLDEWTGLIARLKAARE